MKHKSIPVLWMGIAFGVAFGLAAAVLAVHGTDPKSLVAALRLTARWAFLLFWLAYAGGAMAALFGPALESLAGRGRELGLAFAAAMLVHLGLVAWLFKISSSPPLSEQLIVFFLIGIFWVYLLAIFSFGGLSKTLGSKGWRILRIVGMNYILFAFAFDFVPVAIREGMHVGVWRFIQYAPFATMSVVAPFLLLAAALQRRSGMRFKFAELRHRIVGRMHRYVSDMD
ncbi:MAG TPA: hypothetical protein VMD75_16015 [Candidatus Binataceae bacterium]|nr:hypothetical protein [Candidatus Binataceae bacterium]